MAAFFLFEMREKETIEIAINLNQTSYKTQDKLYAGILHVALIKR